jgi:hypothetical protein
MANFSHRRTFTRCRGYFPLRLCEDWQILSRQWIGLPNQIHAVSSKLSKQIGLDRIPTSIKYASLAQKGQQGSRRGKQQTSPLTTRPSANLRSTNSESRRTEPAQPGHAKVFHCISVYASWQGTSNRARGQDCLASATAPHFHSRGVSTVQQTTSLNNSGKGTRCTLQRL